MSSNHDNGERNIQREFQEQLDSLRRTFLEMQYDTKNYNHLYLLSAELLTTYIEKLLRDGVIPRATQIEILDDMFKVSNYIVQKATEEMNTVSRIQSK